MWPVQAKRWLQLGSMYSDAGQSLLECLRSVCSTIFSWIDFFFRFTTESIFLRFHRNRMASLSLLEFKQLMLILCNTQDFEQFTVEEFNLAADHNRCVNRFRLESIIKVMAKFFIYLEDNTFYRTQSFAAMIKECFEQVNTTNFDLVFIRSAWTNHSFTPNLVSRHNRFDWIAIYCPLAKTANCFFALFKCAGTGLSHQRIAEHCPRRRVC